MVSPITNENEIKIFIVYLMDKIGYPLDYNTIGSVVVQEGVVNYFDFGESFYKLIEAGHVEKLLYVSDDGEYLSEEMLRDVPEKEIYEAEATEGIKRLPEALYRVTHTGREVARELSDSILLGIRERSYQSALRLLDFNKKGAVINHSYKPEGDGYMFNCCIKDKSGVLAEMSVKVDTERQLKKMVYNFTHRPEVVYRGVIALLTGDANYIFN